jgi:putative MATE family efflux protein
MNQNTLFEKTTPTRLFFHFAIPSMISMAVSSLYTIADGIFVGRFLGQQSLAAVNLVMPLIMICFGLSDMVAVGSSVQISIQLGRKEHDGARRTFSSCLKIIALSSCLIGILCFFLAEPALRILGAEPEVALLAEEYLRVYALFLPLIAGYFAIDNYLRICGKPRYSMAINIATAVLNILLDFLFVAVLGYGVWSAALASCLSLILGMVLGCVPFLSRKLPLYFVRGNISLHQFMRLLANGSSELFSNIASSILMLILNTVLLHLGGSVAVAACSVVLYVDSVANSIVYGLVDSMQPAISYCYGCNLRKRVRALEKRVLAAAAIISIGTLMLMRFGGGDLIALFVRQEDAALLDMSLQAMKLFSLSYLVSWVDVCCSSYLTALDRPGRSLAVSLCGTLIFPLVSLGIMAPIWGLDGVWCMPLAAGVASAVVSIIAVLSITAGNKRCK